MINYSVVEVEKKEDYFSIAHPSIAINVTNSRTALKMLMSLLPEIGKIQRIVQNRDSERVYFETFIIGAKYTVVLKDAFTSGYAGVGAKVFKEFLEHVGLSTRVSEQLIFKEEPKRAVLKIDFTN